MLLYILKSAACLAILLVFYKIFLERENMHTFKRFYLLGALFVAFIIPFLTFVEYIEIPEVTPIMEPSTTHLSYVPSTIKEEIATDYIAAILWSIYGIGIAVFGFKFIKNLSRIIQRIRNNPKLRINRITNVLLRDSIIPHTFFNYIFLNKQKFEAKEIPAEVLLHEKTHAKQKHSFDILFAEFVQLIFWFNPVIYILKKAIKLNHEFLADREVVRKGIKPSIYQNILLEFSSNPLQLQLANSINYSSIKKRFTVMKKTTSKRSTVLRGILFIPLLVFLLYGFSEKIVIPLYEEPSTAESFVNVQQGATKAQIDEYNALASKYNKMSKDDFRVIGKDVRKLEYIYSMMSAKQRKNAEPFPNFPPPPPPPTAPKAVKGKTSTVSPKAPKAPRVKKGVKSDIPPQPPSASNLSDVEIADKVIDEIIAHQDPYDINPMPPNILKGEMGTIPPTSPAALNTIREVRELNNYIKGEKDTFLVEPLAPPPPKSPLEHVKEMAKKDAIFYYEGKEISSDKAISVLKKNKKINLRTRHEGLKRPIVELSTSPIVMEN